MDITNQNHLGYTMVYLYVLEDKPLEFGVPYRQTNLGIATKDHPG